MDLTKLSEAELEGRNQQLMLERGKAEAKFKGEQTAIQAELTRRAVTARVTTALEGVSADQRAAILKSLKGA